MVAKPVTDHSVLSRALLAPGDVGIGTTLGEGPSLGVRNGAKAYGIRDHGRSAR